MSVLVITNKVDFPADEVIHYLRDMNVDVFRFNTEDLCSEYDVEVKVSNNSFNVKIDSKFDSIDFDNIRSVFYRRPKRVEADYILNSSDRDFIESEISTFQNWLWKAADLFWVSKPICIRAADSKINQLRIAPGLGFDIPKTLITNKPESILDFYEECKGKIVNKVLAKGMIESNGKMLGIYTHRVEEKHLQMLDSVRSMPCVFQELVEKRIEIRITVVGNRVFATEIHSQNSERTKYDWRRYDFSNTPHKPHILPKEIEERCLNMVAHYNLTFSAIDMIVTPSGDYIFLEINPNGQWLWIEQLTGQKISKSIAEMLARGSL